MPHSATTSLSGCWTVEFVESPVGFVESPVGFVESSVGPVESFVESVESFVELHVELVEFLESGSFVDLHRSRSEASKVV